MKDLKLRMIMEKEILGLIEASEGGKEWLAEKLMDCFEENSGYVHQEMDK